jgi:hypothetical protein
MHRSGAQRSWQHDEQGWVLQLMAVVWVLTQQQQQQLLLLSLTSSLRLWWTGMHASLLEYMCLAAAVVAVAVTEAAARLRECGAAWASGAAITPKLLVGAGVRGHAVCMFAAYVLHHTLSSLRRCMRVNRCVACRLCAKHSVT